ncbi:MAG: porin family protein [Muribaculaceae bacterium]|nr:porin family protein [Muribaculaceae bacterium]
MDDKWIDDIREKMGGYEVIPPDGFWNSVQNEIKARRVRKWRIFTAVAASIALFGGIFMTLVPGRIDSVDTSGFKAYKRESGSFTAKVVTGNAGTETINLQHVNHSGRGVAFSNLSEASHENSIKAENIDLCETHEEVQTKGTYDEKSDCYESLESPVSDDSCHYEWIDKESETSPSYVSLALAVSANGLGGLLNNNDISAYSFGNNPSSVIPSTRMGGGVIDNSWMNDRPDPSYIEVFDHKLPLRFSIDFSWEVMNHLNIDTGITYSCLMSDINFGYSDSRMNKAVQTLHFLGIPVNVRYTPWRFRNFEIYASAGVMAEKCISGIISGERTAGATYRYDGCDDRPFQFSVNASAGLQYDFSRKCSVYLEPGLGLYMKNGSKLRSIYSERPVTFNVSVGLRFDLSSRFYEIGPK